MPIYEFVCEFCEYNFDKLQKHTDENPACPRCESNTAKIISAPSFILKGQCWASDGYTKKESSFGEGGLDSLLDDNPYDEGGAQYDDSDEDE